MNRVRQQPPQHRSHALARTLLAMLLVGVWLVGAGVIGGTAPASSPGTSGVKSLHAVPVAAASYVVQPGDTLWSVARRLRPEGDIRPLIDHLGRQTGGSPLRAGQRISLP